MQGNASAYFVHHLVQALLPYVPIMLELVQRCLADEDRQETVVRWSVGLVGDLADAFPQGQIKQYLLVEWLSLALRQKARLSPETKKTLRWTKEASPTYVIHLVIVG